MSSLIFNAANQLAQTNLPSKQLALAKFDLHTPRTCACTSRCRRERKLLRGADSKQNCFTAAAWINRQFIRCSAPPEFIFIYLFRQAVAGEERRENSPCGTQGGRFCSKSGCKHKTERSFVEAKAADGPRANKLIRVRESRAGRICSVAVRVLGELFCSKRSIVQVEAHSCAQLDHLIFSTTARKKREEEK